MTTNHEGTPMNRSDSNGVGDVTGNATAKAEVRRMLRTLRRRWRAVVIVTLLTAGLGSALGASRGDRYEASAKLLLQRPGAAVQHDTRSASDADRALANEVLFMQSNVLHDAVTAKLGRDANVSVSAKTGSDLVTLKATSVNASAAAATANAYATIYLELRRQRLATESAALLAKITDVDRKIAEAGVSADAAAVQDRNRLEADRQDLYAQLRTVDLAATGIGDPPQLVSPAVLPTSPVSTSLSKTAATFLVLGLLLGFAVAFIAEFFDSRILDEDDLASVSGIRTFSVIRDRSSRSPRDAYALLRFQLVQGIDTAEHRMVAIAPVDASGAGAATTLALGAECAAAGAKVLLIGATLGSKELPSRVGLADDRGLSTIIAGEDTFASIEQPIPGHEGVTVVFAGPRVSSVSTLGSRQALAVIRSLREEAEIVLLETPSVTSSQDAVSLISTADAAVLVVTRKTTTALVEQALNHMYLTGVTLIATVLVPKPVRIDRLRTSIKSSLPASSSTARTDVDTQPAETPTTSRLRPRPTAVEFGAARTSGSTAASSRWQLAKAGPASALGNGLSVAAVEDEYTADTDAEQEERG